MKIEILRKFFKKVATLSFPQGVEFEKTFWWFQILSRVDSCKKTADRNFFPDGLDNSLTICPNAFKPLFYKRYVDDTFLIFRSPTHIPLFLDFLNSQHPNIEFTSEIEKDRKLAFLDVEVLNSFGQFSTSVYRKPTFTGLLSKFNSAAPLKYKRSLITTLVTRAYKTCSSYFSLHKEFTFLKHILTQNG